MIAGASPVESLDERAGVKVDRLVLGRVREPLPLVDPTDDVMYVFHDPAQTLYRDNVVERLGLTPQDLVRTSRNPQAESIEALWTVLFRLGGAGCDSRGGTTAVECWEMVQRDPSIAAGFEGAYAVVVAFGRTKAATSTT